MADKPRFVDVTERMIYLRSIPVAASLGTPVIKIIARNLKERSFKSGDMLMREGEPIESLHLLTDGRLDLVRKGKPFGSLAPPQSLGFLGIIARGDGTYDARAELDTRSLELDAETLLELMEDHFELLSATLKYVSERLLYEVQELPAETLTARMDGTELLPPRQLDLVERMVYLQTMRPFARANLSALAVLAQLGTSFVHPAGTPIWRQNDPADKTMILISGLAECRTAEGKTWLAGPNSAVGAMDTLSGKPRWHDVEARSTISGLWLPTQGFLELLEDDFSMASTFIATIAADLIGVLEKKAAEGKSTVGVPRPMTKLGSVPVGA
jgi:CRP-like cAMP-binding protein